MVLGGWGPQGAPAPKLVLADTSRVAVNVLREGVAVGCADLDIPRRGVGRNLEYGASPVQVRAIVEREGGVRGASAPTRHDADHEVA